MFFRCSHHFSSDILVISKLYGSAIKWLKARVHGLKRTVQNKADIDCLKIAEADDLPYVMDALRLTKKN